MEPLSAAKFVSGYSPTGFIKAFAIGSKIAIIVALGWFLYVGMIKPHTNPTPTTAQSAEQIINNEYNYPEKKSLIDFKVWIFRIKVW